MQDQAESLHLFLFFFYGKCTSKIYRLLDRDYILKMGDDAQSKEAHGWLMGAYRVNH